MKNFRNYYKLISVLLLTLWMVGCEQENDYLNKEQHEHHGSLNHEASNFKKVTIDKNDFIGTFVQQKVAYTHQKSANNTIIETPLGGVVLNDVILTEDEEGIKNYSFRIIPKRYEKGVFYNLIVNEHPNVTEPDVYALKYEMSESFRLAYTTGASALVDFEGTMARMDMDQVFALRTSNQKSGYCGDGDGGTDFSCDIITIGDSGSDGTCLLYTSPSPRDA